MAAERGMRAVRGWVALLALLAGRAAWADPKDDARRHFIAGLEAAKEHDYQRSLDEFLAAQAAYPHPATLYNIARAYTDLGEYQQAIDYYRLYQDAAPEHAEDVEPVIAVLEAKLRRQRQAAAVGGAAAPVGGAAAPAEGAAAPADTGRLQAIARQLAELSAELERAATAPPAGTGGPAAGAPAEAGAAGASGEAPAEEPAADAALAAGALKEDAYRRVVVTASRYGQDPLDAPSSVTVLTADDIRASGATNIPDLLRQVVGVDVMQLSAAQPDVSIRGFNRELSNKVLVLVDGRSVYLDLLGTVLWGTLPVSLDEIERIEIIRGPGSAIYGANAVTGVINIITRPPGEGPSSVHLEGGLPGYEQGTALVTGRAGATSYRLSVGNHRTGRWSTDRPVTEDGPLVSMVEDQDHSLDVVRANGRLDRRFADRVYASLSGGYVEGVTEFYVFGALGDYALDGRSGYARGDLSAGDFHLRGFVNTLSGTAGPWTEYAGARTMVAEVRSGTYDLEGETLQSFSTGPVDHQLNLGLGWRLKTIRWGYLRDDIDLDEHIFSGFLQDEARMGALALVGSLRFDRTELVPLSRTISPRAAAILHVAPRTALRLLGGTSFRAPTQMESYLDLDQATSVDGVVIRTRGDTDLLPERIFTVETGLHDESGSWHRADVALYYNRVDQLIFVSDVDPTAASAGFDPDIDGVSAGTVRFENLDPYYDAIGAELEGRIFPADGLDLYLNLDLQQVWETTPASQSGPETTRRDGQTSAVKANAGAIWRSPWRADLSAHVSALSPQTWTLREYDESGELVSSEARVGARAIATARLAARPFADDSLELAVTAWNIGALLGEPVREHPKGQLVGGRLYGSLRYAF